MNAKQIVARYKKLYAETDKNWKPHWQEVGDHTLPNYNDIYRDQVAGEKKNILLFDTTAVQANKLLASGLHSMLTNPTLPWFELTTGRPDLDSKENVRMWLQRAVKSIHDVLNNTNFQTEIHEIYLALGTFGTAICFMEEDKDKVINFNTKPIYYGVLDENSQGLIDTVMVEFEWELRKIIDKFGFDSLPEKLKNQKERIEKLLDDKYKIIHAVYPRKDKIYYDENGNRKAGTKNMAYASCYVMSSEAHTLMESGFNEFPYLCPRWAKLPGEKYGRSPAMDALPDIKVINAMAKVNLEAAQFAVRPPLEIEDDGINQAIDYYPGAVNIRRPGSQRTITPINTGVRPDLGEQLMEPIKKRIENHFYINQLQTAESTTRKTATEVIQLTDEKLRIMAPILARMNFELLSPLIDRVFFIMGRAGRLPDKMPDELKGMNLTVQFSSMIARAQRAVEAEVLPRVLNVVGPLAQAKPEILDNFNTDGIVVETAQMLGLSQKMLNDKGTVSAIRDGRKQVAEQQAQMQQAQMAADVAQKTSGIT